MKTEIIYKRLDEIKPYERNPRVNDAAVEAVAASIKEFGFKVPIVIDKNMTIVCGHTRYKAALKLGMKEVPTVSAADLTARQIKAFRLADNKTSELSDWDYNLLDLEIGELGDYDLEQFGFMLDSEAAEAQRVENTGIINKRFIVPPLSILDRRQAYWQEREKAWNGLIGDDAQARDKLLFTSKFVQGAFRETSVISPVLCEIACRWFLPNTDDTPKNVFDCFAGDTGFAFVSSYLKHNFTGIELRQEQVEFNLASLHAAGLEANIICDDGRNVAKHIKEKSQDLFFSCPPYFDLEVYSDKENDASNQKSYQNFMQIIDEAFTASNKCLNDNRFAFIVCSDIRNKKTGDYYGFPDDIKKVFRREGMLFYNDFVLVDPVGTAAKRASHLFDYRKAGRCHQNVLVFYKGDQKHIKEHFARIEECEEALKLDGSED